MPRFKPSSSTLIVWSLVSSGALIAMLGWQGYDASRSHRATAEAVLRDYARFAADQFAVHARETLEARLTATLAPLACPAAVRAPATTEASAAATLAMPSGAAASAPGPGCPSALPWQALVAWDGPRGPVRVLRVAGSPAADRGAAAHAVASLRSSRERLCPPGAWPCLVLDRTAGDGAVTALGLWPARDANGATHAAVTSVGAIIAVLDGILSDRRLLPHTLASESRARGWLRLQAIRDSEGRALLSRPANASDAKELGYTPFMATVSLGQRYAGLAVDIGLDPAAAPSLVIGGLPASRLPAIAALLLVAAALAAVAIGQLRREQRLLRARTAFITRASHELRTPITQVKLFAQTLRLGRVRTPDEATRSLAIIEEEADHLSHLVDNLLQCASSVARSASAFAATELVDAGATLAQEIERFTPAARERGAQIVLHTEPHTFVRVDRNGLRQIVANLLDNAIKYGPPTQTIGVHLTSSSTVVRIAIHDEGPGIPTADREAIWTAFVRLERDVERCVPGTGIGLTVVHDLVRAAGGRVWVDTPPTGGARFIVELPAIRVDARGTLRASA